MVFHVLNQGVGRRRLFHKSADYAAFEAILEETLEKSPMRICSYCQIIGTLCRGQKGTTSWRRSCND
jgi:hypothetical protein